MRLRNVFRPFLARCLPFHGHGTAQVRRMTNCVHPSTHLSGEELFKYTSGRWIFNEDLRLKERHLEFDIAALQSAVAAATTRSTSDIVSFNQLAEGGFNRLFQVTFNDGKHVIARLPYPSTVPQQHTVASEVATLDYLRLNGVNTPKVYAWCSKRANLVGAEYIIMEKLDGIPLGEVWYTMTPKQQHGIMKQIVEWETRLMSMKFPASGSIYYQKDLASGQGVPLLENSDRGFCIGPMAHYSWWHDERAILNADRGPWASSNDIFRAVGERELKWTKAYAKPRLPYERLYREIYNFSPVSPDSHIQALSDYLTLAQCLGFKAESPLNRPVIRHPDFQPNNILVSETNEIVGLIDWQHCTILPLGIAAGIPKHFQNYGDPDSEKLRRPQTTLPPDYDSLSLSEQASVRETMRRRVIHFLYAALTKRLNPEHYDAIFNQSSILHQRLFKSAGSPWEGDSITLQADIISAVQNWPTLITEDSLDARQKEADIAMEQMRNFLDVDVLGWVPNEDYETAKETVREIKAKMLQVAETKADIMAVKDHFPFDDFDETS